MAFDNFEAVDETLLSNIEAGQITWGGFVGATAEGAWTGAIGGATAGSMTLPVIGSVPGYVGGGILGGNGGAVANGSWYLITGGD
ncbi:bacteriocin [Streptococcus ursoris]|uniref:Bacteriocin n=2 Tax=Streptococcus ratti TaxID=1341 RepID=A0A7X9LCZ9_STRRT|nr:bacteriocin [Streptococcus ratti]